MEISLQALVVGRKRIHVGGQVLLSSARKDPSRMSLNHVHRGMISIAGSVRNMENSSRRETLGTAHEGYQSGRTMVDVCILSIAPVVPGCAKKSGQLDSAAHRRQIDCYYPHSTQQDCH